MNTNMTKTEKHVTLNEKDTEISLQSKKIKMTLNLKQKVISLQTCDRETEHTKSCIATDSESRKLNSQANSSVLLNHVIAMNWQFTKHAYCAYTQVR